MDCKNTIYSTNISISR